MADIKLTAAQFEIVTPNILRHMPTGGVWSPTEQRGSRAVADAASRLERVVADGDSFRRCEIEALAQRLLVALREVARAEAGTGDQGKDVSR